MARRAEFYTQVGDGPKAVSVGYSSTERNGYLGVRFVGPNNTRIEKMTACKKRDGNYHLEAAKLIVKAFAPTMPNLKKVKWDDAVEEVVKTCPDLRPATLETYRKAIKQLRATLDADDKLPGKPSSPSDITDELASRFGRLFLSGTFRRGKAEDATKYKRSPRTLKYYLVALSGLWKHFAELGYVKNNPWRDVRKPQVERKRKDVPQEQDVAAFVNWLRSRYPTWQRLHALIELKAITACRTLDLVQLRSDQLRDGRIVWDANQTKTKEGRAVLLPDALFGMLKSVAGDTFLWENILDDMKVHRPGRNKLPATFAPKTVYWLIGNLFREFNEAHPDKPRLTPHALRRRAITLTVLATQNVDATAQAIGVNPQTARAYYLDAQRAFNADEVFKKVADLLVPKTEQGK